MSYLKLPEQSKLSKFSILFDVEIEGWSSSVKLIKLPPVKIDKLDQSASVAAQHFNAFF